MSLPDALALCSLALLAVGPCDTLALGHGFHATVGRSAPSFAPLHSEQRIGPPPFLSSVAAAVWQWHAWLRWALFALSRAAPNNSFNPKTNRCAIVFGLILALGRMKITDERIIAWILLAISFWDRKPVTRSEILHSADAINHAVPVESEIALAIRFLTKHGIVEKNGKFFVVTESGQAIVDSAHRGAQNIFDAWKALESHIASMDAA
jgi:hypothetical protein